MTVNIILIILLVISLGTSYMNILSSAGTTTVLMIIGYGATIPVVISAIRSLYKRKISVDLLASIALFVSILHGEWASVVFINLMITSARIFGEYTEGKARSSIKSLLKLRPEKVKVKIGKELIVKSIKEIQIGDLVVIESGERVPIDGKIIEGDGSIDQSSLTGESLPIEKHEGDTVLSSTLVTSGSFLVRTEKIGKDTTFEKIIQLVETAQAGKAGIQTVVDVFSSWYIILTFVVATSLYLITRDNNLVLSVLLVTCADDIAVAIPMAFWAAVAYAAKRGIIIKGGNYLEAMTKVKTMLVDKTGTLTKGRIAVHLIHPFGSETQRTALRLASYAACISGHPLSKAILARAAVEKIHEEPPEKFREYPGKGVMAERGGKYIYLGNTRLMSQFHIRLTYEQTQTANKIEARGNTVIYLGYENGCIALFAFADEPRIGVKKTVDMLHKLGIHELIMLTGDNEKVARYVMEETGVDTYHANLLPEEKVAYIKTRVNSKTKIAFVGDGVNDAAALAAADIGIAMGAIGSDAAIEAADIALMNDRISAIPEIIFIGKRVMQIARQNFIIWGVVNAVGLLLVFGKLMGPPQAAAFNFITDFFPLLNSLRLFQRESFDKAIS